MLISYNNTPTPTIYYNVRSSRSLPRFIIGDARALISVMNPAGRNELSRPGIAVYW